MRSCCGSQTCAGPEPCCTELDVCFLQNQIAEGCDPAKYPVYQAECYVLAASPVESARLLFLSDSSRELGNSSGNVG